MVRGSKRSNYKRMSVLDMLVQAASSQLIGLGWIPNPKTVSKCSDLWLSQKRAAGPKWMCPWQFGTKSSEMELTQGHIQMELESALWCLGTLKLETRSRGEHRSWEQTPPEQLCVPKQFCKPHLAVVHGTGCPAVCVHGKACHISYEHRLWVGTGSISYLSLAQCWLCDCACV